MPFNERWIMDGNVYKTHDGAAWIKPHGTFDPFAWLGGCARIDEGSESLGGVTVTAKRNPRGGLSRHEVLAGAPAESTTTLTIKRLQADRKKTDLRECWWDLDNRIQCGGMDEEAWNKWSEITRYCYGKATERTTPAIAFDGDAEEQLVSLAWTALWVDDLYRVTGEIGSPLAGMTVPLAIMFTDITSCQAARCPDICDDQEDCVVVAVTETVALGTPYIAVNLHGGDLDAWTDPPLALTSFGVNNADQVACAGEFLIVVSSGDTSLIYSDNLGTTQVNIATVDMVAHAPHCVDMIDQSFAILGGANGYIFGSNDAARTWRVLDAGYATTNTITRIMIARDNPQVIYGISNAADVVVKSDNGGKTWVTMTATGTAGTGPTALCVCDHRHVIVGTDAGEIFETSDGGATWTEQVELPGLSTKANTTVADIVACGCGVIGLITENSADDERMFYRNVDNGASGKWYKPTSEAVASGKSLAGLTCCGPNHFVACGGATVTDDQILLLE